MNSVTRRQKEEIESTKSELKHIKDNEALVLRTSNQKMLAQLTPLLKEVPYVADRNGELTFYDKDFNLIEGSNLMSQPIVDEEKSVDGALYGYNRLYKTYSLNEEKDGTLSLEDFSSKEIINVPDEILLSMKLSDKSSDKLIEDNQLPKGLIQVGKSTLPTSQLMVPFDDMTSNSDLSKINLRTEYAVTTDDVELSIRLAIKELQSNPSQFMLFENPKSLNQIEILIEDNFFLSLTKKYKRLELIFKFNLDDYLIVALPREYNNKYSLKIGEDSNSYYQKNLSQASNVDQMVENLSFSIIGVTYDLKSKKEVLVYELLPTIGVKFDFHKNLYSFYFK